MGRPLFNSSPRISSLLILCLSSYHLSCLFINRWYIFGGRKH